MDLYEKNKQEITFPNGQYQNSVLSDMKGRPEGRKFGLEFQPWHGVLLQILVNDFGPDQKSS